MGQYKFAQLVYGQVVLSANLISEWLNRNTNKAAVLLKIEATAFLL